MRKTLKFLHTMAAIGFTGGLAALIVLHLSLPDPGELQQFAALRLAMGAVAEWILFPSMGVVLVSGLLSMAATPAFQNQGWVLAKLLSGILVFESTLVYVQSPMEKAALRAQAALDGRISVAELGTTLGPEWGSFWVIMAVAVFNIVLGVWRPRFSRAPSPAAATATGAEGATDTPAPGDSGAEGEPDPNASPQSSSA